eukprot:NODE_221_length_1174_cov_208.014222_g184_i1.p5 GENE.NODE_221_length_1174_cov_208.014222_g184_i1~~NODE_221_length_1174_cov_208.014222_g184_i1.p5  ORF type:complete len:63 (+),score=0.59 NODE_221_length_1174_cov_208.014222_g184_i1:339-527(+)
MRCSVFMTGNKKRLPGPGWTNFECKKKMPGEFFIFQVGGHGPNLFHTFTVTRAHCLYIFIYK